MRTDDLIDVLAMAQERQPRRPPVLPIAFAGLIGFCVALASTFATLGVRPDLIASFGHPVLWIKLGVTLSIVMSAGFAARRLSLPGRTWFGAKIVLAATFIFLGCWAIVDLITKPVVEWAPCIEGHDWITCLIAIPLLALVPMLAMGAAMRRLAPTRLGAAGALLGMASGAVGALAFSLYCSDDAIPFLVVWYGAALAVSTSIGWALGPRLLRW